MSPARGHGLATLALTACGFQLRTWDFTTTFDTARIDAEPGVDLDVDLGRALESAGVRLVDADAAVVVRLADQRDDWRSVSVTRGARTAEYELALQVTFAVDDASGAELAAARVLRSEPRGPARPRQSRRQQRRAQAARRRGPRRPGRPHGARLACIVETTGTDGCSFPLSSFNGISKPAP